MADKEETKQTLGEHCKLLERSYTQGDTWSNADHGIRIPCYEYAVIRVDGRAFHKFTKPYKVEIDPHTKERRKVPFSDVIIGAMKAAVEALIAEFSPVVAYTQSDEITLVIEPHKVSFGGKCHKLNSIAASVATAAFNGYLYNHSLFRSSKVDKKDKKDKKDNKPSRPAELNEPPRLATFDARSYGASREDVLKILIWRQKDAIKNSISSVAQVHFSHKLLESKNSDERIAMLNEKGVDWNSFPYGCKYGLTAFRVLREVNLDIEALKKNNVPEHVIKELVDANGLAMRNVTEYPELPKFTDIANLDAVIFEHADPLYTTSAAWAALNKETPNED